MTRRDLRTIGWLAPLGLLLSLWWIFRSSPCLDNHLAARWQRWFPSVSVAAARPSAPEEGTGVVVVENPYGILTCDHWPTLPDHVITGLLWWGFTALIGFLAARTLEHDAAKRAASITGAGLALAFVISGIAYLPGLLRDAGHLGGYVPAAIEIGLSLAFILVGALHSGFVAWLTLRWRARATAK
jgi:hypothetical protein